MTDRDITQPGAADGVSRRQFLATSAVAGAAAFGTAAFGTAAAALAEAVPLPQATLGRTGQKVPILAAGTAFNLTPIILRAFESQGITYLDTAQGYNGGNSEKEVGRYFDKSGRRKQTFLVTKCYNHNPAVWTRTLAGSLQSLQTDYVDVYYLHNLGDPDRLDGEIRAAAERLKKAGQIRFFGFSSHHDRMIDVLERAPEVGFVDVIMFKYSFRDFGDERLKKAIDRCHEAGIGLVAMKTQAGNAGQPPAWEGFNRHQAALKAMWQDERITSICSEMDNVQKVRDNADAARQGPRMGRLERARLRQYAEATSHLYCRGCGHLCQSRVAADTAVADILRFRMYCDDYGKRRDARRLFAELPEAARRIDGVDFTAAEAVCPYGLAIGSMMRDAAEKLA